MWLRKLCLLFILNGLLEVSGNFICPPVIEILPCSCDPGKEEEKSSVTLLCEGPFVTQDSIDNLFSQIRSVNNISSEDSNSNPTNSSQWLDINLFVVRYSGLNTIDLRPLTNCHFNKLDLGDNPKLEYIVMSVLSVDEAMAIVNNEKEIPLQIEQENFKLSAHEVRLDFCNLKEKEIGNLIKYLIPETVTKLSLARNKIKGPLKINHGFDVDGVELVPGLSKLKNLKTLSLHGNQIRRILAGSFKYNTKLTKIDLAFNEIRELDTNAFLQYPDVTTSQNKLKMKLKKKGLFKQRPLVIDLSNNLLTDAGVHPLAFHGLHLRTTTFVSLDDNQFETISLKKFDQLGENEELRKGKEFDIYFSFSRNPLICDDRMRWLQSGRKILEKFFWGVNCHNDLDKDVFDPENVIPYKKQRKQRRLGVARNFNLNTKMEKRRGILKPIKSFVKPYVKGFWSFLEEKMQNAELI